MPITPISPTVQAYQQNMAQDQASASPEQQAFNKKFGDAAFSILSTKYPQIMKYIITYKVLDSDIENGSGTGAFIIRKGASVAYLPVIMASGRITSCEMMYVKDDQSFEPLNIDTIKQIEAANDLQDPKVIGKAPFVDSTQQVFKDMFRPPSRSNVVIASDSSFDILPNAAKEAISNYLQDNPQFLAKIAEFYPIEVLGNKLAKTKEVVASELKEDTTVELLRLSDLTKEAAAILSQDEKEELLQRGYYVQEPSTPRTKVASIQNMAVDVITKMNITEYSPSEGYAGKAKILIPQGLDVVPKDAIIAEGVLFTKEGYSSVTGGSYVYPRYEGDGSNPSSQLRSRYGSASKNSIIISEATDTLSRNDLLNYGAVTVDQYKPKDRPALKDCPSTGSMDSPGYEEYNKKNAPGKVFIFYPRKSGTYSLFPYNFLPRFGVCKTNVDGTTYLGGAYNQDTLGFIPQLQAGFVSVGEHSYMLPTTCLIIDADEARIGKGITSISALQKLLTSVNTKITLQNDGVDIKVTDTKTEKTATYHDEASYHYAMVKQYGLSKEAADLLLKEKKVLLLDKIAFIQPSQVEGPNQQDQQAPMPFAQPQQPQPQQMANNYSVDPSSMQAAAELQDEDLMDTGILASVASNDDIKGTLVDLLPTFTDTVTNLGKTVLMFTSSQEDLEDHYGSDEYTTVLSNLRKIFTNLGKLVYDLKSYINMNQHK